MLVEVRDLKKYFPIRTGLFSKKQIIRAVDGITFSIKEKETFGLVGESGCGKTTLGRTILRLIEPSSGEIKFMGKEISSLREKELFPLRRYMQIIFQDPYSALNPQKTVYQTLSRPFKLYGKFENNSEIIEAVSKILEEVGLSPPSDYLNKFPDELSGGERQRVVIARAVATRPKFVVADEPISKVDAHIRGQLLDLMQEIQRKTNVSYLYITHDLLTARYVCHRIAVMYLGEFVEVAPANELFRNPLHPYTEGLLYSIPVPDPDVPPPKGIKGEPVSIVEHVLGCKFYNRCPYVRPICKKEKPRLIQVGKKHFVSCHFAS
jgi:oligopeptide/dipeptide ABC transporter ATP-binding protein